MAAATIERTATPLDIFERLHALPEHLQAHNRRFIVEAVSKETRAPLLAFYSETEIAQKAAQEWGEAHSAAGFYSPHGRNYAASSVFAFSFKTDAAPSGPAWVKAGRGFINRHGYVAMYPSKRPAGRAITAELAELPKFPGDGAAIEHLGAITDLRVGQSGGGVGHSDGALHFSVPMRVSDRVFVSAVNHNYDIAKRAEQAAEYLAGDHPEWASSLDFDGDPIAWRPAAGWAFLSEGEFNFIVAEARLEAERERSAA